MLGPAHEQPLFVFQVLVLRGGLSAVVQCYRLVLSLVRKQLHTLLLLLLLYCRIVPQDFLGRAGRRFLLRHFAVGSRGPLV